MNLSRSTGLVRRILSLSAVFGALILLEGSEPSSGSQSAPRPVSAAAERKVPSQPPPPPAKEFRPAQGRGPVQTLAEGEVHAYLFDLVPNDFLEIVVEQNDLDVAVNVFAPEKQLLFTVDSLNGATGPESIPLLAESAGQYRVEVEKGGRGTYRIVVPLKRKATTRDRQNAVGALAYSRGKGLVGQRQNRLAEREFEQALASWKQSGNLAGQADVAYQLEKLLRDRSAQTQALPLLLQASALYHRLGNLQQEAIVLTDLGMTHSRLGDVDQALSAYEEALVLVRKTHTHDLEANALFDRGRLYLDEGEYGKAVADLETALAIRRTLSKPVKVAEALNALGRAYYELEDLEGALRLHREALAIVRTHPDDIVMASTLTHLADLYRKKGDFERAVLGYLRALAIFQRVGRPQEEATVLNNLGLAYFRMGRNTEALGAFQQCQRAYDAQGATGNAAIAWTNLGWVLAEMGRYEQAAESYKRSLTAAGDKNHAPTEVAAYFGRSWAEWRRGNLIAARSLVEKSLVIMESLRTKAERRKLRASYLASRQDLYEFLVEILMEQHRREPAKGYDLRAFEVSERARSRSLLDDLEGRPVVPSLSVQDIQRQVLGTEDDVVLLEYSLGERRSFLWVVTSSSFASYELPSRAQIQALSQEVHGLIRESNRREARSLAIRKALVLSRLLFGPVAGRLQGKKLLIVAPPALQYISFGALPKDSRESRRQGTNWPTSWIVNHEIVVEPSANVLATLRRRHESRQPPPGLLAVLADPVFSAADERVGVSGSRSGGKVPFPRLRFSQLEASAIYAVAPGDKKLMALGFDANRQKVLDGGLKDYRNLHFSTHGVLNQEEADYSALVLSRLDRLGKPIEGFLRAGEIAKLDLRAELVVLSACQTGLGREIRGEGLVGLSQAFFSAGATRVMVSLWDVDEQPTSKLMERFYRNLFQENLSPAAALREAQTWMWMQPKWNAPSYWAGFVLQGEWQ